MGRGKVQNIFGTYLCRQSTLVLESQPHLFIFNLVKFGAFFELFLGLSGLFFGLGSDSKNLLLPTYIDNQLWFWKYSHIFLFSIWPHLGPFLHFFGPFGAIFWPFGAYCVVGVRFKNIFGTYLCRQSTLVLESQPHLFIFNLVKFGAFFELFLGLSGLFFGLGSDSKNLLLPTYIDNQLWFWKYSHIFLFSIWPHLGPFLHFFGPFGAIFWPFGAYCVVGVRFKNIFGTYLCRKSTLVLEIQPYLFVYNLAKFGAFFYIFWAFRGYFWGWGQVQKKF